MNIAAQHLASLFDYATFQGIPEHVLRNYLNIKDLDLCKVENSITEKEFLIIFHEIMKKVNKNYCGLYYGCYLNLKSLGFINQIALHSSNIEQAVFILQNYLESSFPLVALKTSGSNDKYMLKLESGISDSQLRLHILDVVYCFVYRELRMMVSSDFLPSLHLPYSNTSAYENFLGCRIISGREHLFTFDAQVLHTDINVKSKTEIELLMPKFLKMLNRQGDSHTHFSHQVRNMVLNMCCPELPSFDQVAANFPLSSRTIQRKLKEEGSSFRKITNNIKKELSTYLSKDGRMRTQDIAYTLGYSESSAYLHAVRKWWST